MPFIKSLFAEACAVPAHRGRHFDADAWHALGSALLLLGDRGGATVAFRNALRLDATRIRSLLALGNLLFDSGQCEQALRCFGFTEEAT